MEPKTKRQNGVSDRISELPDGLLCHILTFLQTIYAVRTCVLSKRWKNIWESVPVLDFDHSAFRKSTKLKMVADYVLFLRNTSNIHKFRLSWNYHGIDQYSINSWIHAAMKRKVVELDLLVFSRLGCRTFELSESIFMCKTLVILKLRSNFAALLPASGCFPSLKFLHVTIIYQSCTDSMAKLFSSCPVLEDLTIDGDRHFSTNSSLEVASPTVKTLRICSDDDSNGRYNYLINCPKLENLTLMGNYSQKYHLGKAESLLKASIELLHCVDLDPRFSQVTSVVAGVSSVRFLILSAHCFNVDSLPAFDNLIELKLVIHKCFSWELLTEFLNRSPLLQCLVLEHSATSCKGKYSEPKSDSIPEGPKPRWHATELVPSCLMSNLETVSIEGFKGQQDTMEVAKYFLRNSQVLKKMTISSDPLRAKKQTLYKKLRKVPRVSEACRVDFV